MTIEEAKREALNGLEQAKRDIDAAHAAHLDAAARLNYFKGAHEILLRVESADASVAQSDPESHGVDHDANA